LIDFFQQNFSKCDVFIEVIGVSFLSFAESSILGRVSRCFACLGTAGYRNRPIVISQRYSKAERRSGRSGPKLFSGLREATAGVLLSKINAVLRFHLSQCA
jgi:hypothetical protein